MQESIYLKALEYSSKKQFQGVVFDELRDYIENLTKEKFNAESLLTFFQFVLDTHYWSSSQIGRNPTSDNGIMSQFYSSFKNYYESGKIDVTGHKVVFENFTQKEKYFLNGEGDKRLLEFYELREARINAKEAYRISWFAIGISILALLASPVIQYLWCFFFNISCTP